MTSARRRQLSNLLVATCVVGLGLACAQATRYEVLTFFFDGVPDPNAPDAGSEYEGHASGDQPSPYQQRRVVRQPLSVHPPYATDRCESCHDPYSGRLLKPADAGLCGLCHQDPPGKRMFLHGPVAVEACMTCHEPHSSVELHLLKLPEPAVCLQCHARDDMSLGLHHQDLAEDGCTMCHDPHGGDGPFFLIQRDP